MRKKSLVLAVISIFSAGLSACASSTSRDSADLSRRLGIDLPLPTDGAENGSDSVPYGTDPLTADRAVLRAIAANPEIRARLEDLGVARAELREGRVLSNPDVHARFRTSDHDESGTNTEIEIEQNITDLLTYPLRRRVTATEFTQARLRVGEAVWSFSSDVKSAFYTHQASRQSWEMRKNVSKAAEASVELSRRQFEAGNVNRLAHAVNEALFEEARVRLNEAELDAARTRESLGRLLGLGVGDDFPVIAATLPPVPQEDPKLEDLLALAGENRRQLLAAREERRRLSGSLRLSRFGWLPDLRAGYTTEKEFDGTRVSGPTIGLSIPLFNQGRSSAAKSSAQIRQSAAQVEALEREVMGDVLLAHKELETARKNAEIYRVRVLPLRRQILEESLKQYNFMITGVYQLLDARREEIEAHRSYIEIQKEYWIARTNAERAVGKALPAPAVDVPAESPAEDTPADPHQGHHH